MVRSSELIHILRILVVLIGLCLAHANAGVKSKSYFALNLVQSSCDQVFMPGFRSNLQESVGTEGVVTFDDFNEQGVIKIKYFNGKKSTVAIVLFQDEDQCVKSLEVLYKDGKL